MPKKKISKAEANSISKEIREGLGKELGVYLLDLVIVDEIINRVVKGAIENHFEVIEEEERK